MARDPRSFERSSDLAHNLGLDVIAEGLERADQLEQLRAFGCDYGQGYLFSKPVESDAAHALLAEREAVSESSARVAPIVDSRS